MTDDSRNGTPRAGRAEPPPAQTHVQVEVIDPTAQGDPRIGLTALQDPNQPKRPAQLTPEELREQEPDIVEQLFQARQALARRTVKVEIPDLLVDLVDDDGKLVLDPETGKPKKGPWHIRLRRLHQEEMAEAGRKARRVWTINEKGKREQGPDPVELNSWLIYLATLPEYRTRPGGWDDRRMWERFKVGNGVELIEVFLDVGQKKRMTDAIARISSIVLDEDLVPNSSDVEELS